MMNKSQHSLNNVYSLISIISVFVVGLWYLASIDKKISLLEEHLASIEISNQRFNEIEMASFNNYRASADVRIVNLEERVFDLSKKK